MQHASSNDSPTGIGCTTVATPYDANPPYVRYAPPDRGPAAKPSTSTASPTRAVACAPAHTTRPAYSSPGVYGGFAACWYCPLVINRSTQPTAALSIAITTASGASTTGCSCGSSVARSITVIGSSPSSEITTRW